LSTTEEALKKAMEQKSDEIRLREDALQRMVAEAVRSALGGIYKDQDPGAVTSRPAETPSEGFSGKVISVEEAVPKDGGRSFSWNNGINSIAASIKLKTGDPKKGIILFTCSLRGEGTTTICSNVAVAEAKMSSGNILLIDCNPKNPDIHKLLKIEASPGLTDVLLKKVRWEDAVRKSNRKNFFVLPFGQGISDHFALWSHEEIDKVLGGMREVFEKVFLDGPPILSGPDAEMIAPHVDNVVLIVKANSTRREVVERAIGHIIVQKDILGMVYNQQVFKIPQFIYKRLK
jgi:Mrp family chromosome partitioning ATPase